ncbi:Acetyl-coenzyme A carboxyl transferase alpha chain [Campylobacter coli]|nr:Acetyl-coenzyme A carboxyl transferase alpha chain [Campylobacter coli]
MASYLDFEKNIQQIDEDIINAQIKGDTEAVAILKKISKKKLLKLIKI